jgi:hypothetical protein
MDLGVGLAIGPLGLGWLRPRGLVPTEDRVAETLGPLLGDVFGRFGYWLMVIGLLTGFYGTVLSNQDGFGRLLAHGMRLLLRSFGIQGRWTHKGFLKNTFVIGLVMLIPLTLFLIVGQPVGLLKLSGAIEAAHISFVTGLTRSLNQRSLPPEAKPAMVHLRHHRTRRALLRRIRGDLPEPTRLVRWRLGERNAAVTPRVGMVRLPATAKRPTQPDRGDQCGHEDHQDHGRE